MRPTKEEIAYLLAAFNRSEWDEMELRLGDFRLYLSSREGAEVISSAAAPSSTRAMTGVEPPALVTERAPAPAALPPGALAVRAPSLGRFWRRPKPTEPPFVEVGADVRAGDVVCIVEVMKLFTQVKSDVAGRVLACPVADGAMVEFDDILFVLSPGGA